MPHLAAPMQHQRTSPGFSAAAKAALAGMLVGLLLWLATLAATSAFHQSLHADAGTGSHHCLICVFVHGQVDTTGVGGLSVLFIALCVGLVPMARSVMLTSIDLRLAPSRAPPRFSAPSAR